MNSIAISGRLGKDAEVKRLQNGDSIVEFSVADDVGFGDKKSTNWWRCTAWKKDRLAPYLLKGASVTVFGQVTLRQYEDRDGNARTSFDIRVNDISLHGTSQNAQVESKQQGRQRTQQGGYPPEASGMDGVPF